MSIWNFEHLNIKSFLLCKLFWFWIKLNFSLLWCSSLILKLLYPIPIIIIFKLWFLGQISATEGIKSIGLTTNGITGKRHFANLCDAGLTHINISLDTLIPEKFEFVSRRRGRNIFYWIINGKTKKLEIYNFLLLHFLKILIFIHQIFCYQFYLYFYFIIILLKMFFRALNLVKIK